MQAFASFSFLFYDAYRFTAFKTVQILVFVGQLQISFQKNWIVWNPVTLVGLSLKLILD